MTDSENTKKASTEEAAPKVDDTSPDKKKKEYGGRDGPEPTRYGDWENKGIISDF